MQKLAKASPTVTAPAASRGERPGAVGLPKGSRPPSSLPYNLAAIKKALDDVDSDDSSCDDDEVRGSVVACVACRLSSDVCQISTVGSSAMPPVLCAARVVWSGASYRRSGCGIVLHVEVPPA
jgi:hypothetical protein